MTAPRLTRGTFEGIAAVLRDERPERDGTPWADGARDEWSTVVLAFARMCHDRSNLTGNGNRAFDRDRFLMAAGFVGCDWTDCVDPADGHRVEGRTTRRAYCRRHLAITSRHPARALAREAVTS